MTKFVLLADRRSGTTLVIDCLNNLSRVHCEKRAFGIDKKIKNPTKDRHNGMFFLYRQDEFKRKMRFWFDRKNLIRDFLDAEIYLPNQERDIRGFRLIYNKVFQHSEILNSLDPADTKVLHLVRENVLKTFISFKTAPMHKMHHPREGDQIKTVKLHLDCGTLLSELKQRSGRIQGMRDRIKDFDSLEVTYESFVADRDAEATRIQPFLGLPDVVPFKTDLVKINPDSLEDVVENYQEVRDTLAGTEFERFLY